MRLQPTSLMRSGKALSATTLLLSVTLASADTITLRRDTVVPIRFDAALTIKNSRAGDRFTATVDGDRDLPSGTRFIGRIVDVHPGEKGSPPALELEFREIRLPDGSRQAVRSVPIPLTDRFVRRAADGRFTTKASRGNREPYVLGGTLGGLVLGSIIRKPFEGAVVGTLAGIVLAESHRNRMGDTVVAKGQRMGALIEREVLVRIDRYDEDRWNDRNSDYRRDPRDDRWDDNRERDWREIEHGDRSLRFGDKEQPYRSGNTVMVPLLRTARQMNFSVDVVRQNVIFVEGQESVIRLETGMREARLNGRRVILPRPVENRSGLIYAPLEALASLTDQEVRFDGNVVERLTSN